MNTRPAITLASIAHHPIWVGSKQEMGKGKQGKLPYDPRTGQLASVHDTGTWATLDEAQSWAAMNGGDGVGLVLSQVDNCFVRGVDLDNCRDPETEAIAPWAQEIIDHLATYAEVNPSGTGVTAFFAVERRAKVGHLRG